MSAASVLPAPGPPPPALSRTAGEASPALSTAPGPLWGSPRGVFPQQPPGKGRPGSPSPAG